MRRSAVLNGRLNQRDRARLRGRLDGRKQEPSPPPKEELLVWLRASLNVSDVSKIERLNLIDFLQRTGQFDLPPEERLRALAIFLEPDLLSPQPRAWLALDRIYLYALQMAPRSVWVHHSRALSAKYCAESMSPNDDPSTIRRILKTAWDAGNTAYSIDSTEPDILYLLGSRCYIDADRSLDESLRFFNSAIHYAPDHQWALLYRAHCLHDLERWTDAALAYDRIAPSFFVGPLGWRYELLLEQKAYCRFRSGETKAALSEFERLLDRWIANPKLQFGTLGIYTAEVATGELREQLATRYNSLMQNNDWAWLNMAEQEGASE